MDAELQRLKRLSQEDPTAIPAYIRALERVLAGGPADEGYEIEHFLVLSTAHITEQDNNMLQTCEPAGEGVCIDVISYSYEYGFWVLFPDLRPQHRGYNSFEDLLRILRQQGFSEGFLECCRLAHSLRLTGFRLDTDGSEIDGLPIYDW